MTTATLAERQNVTQVCRNGRTFRATSEVFPGFWQTMAAGRWEADTLRIFDEFIDQQTVVVDIGAWMGPTTLYAAPVAAQILSFEPDPIAYSELTRNIELNRHEPWAQRIDAVNKAVGASAGVMRLGSKEGLGASTSSLLYHDEDGSVDVDVMAFDELADDPRLQRKKVFVKIDIEGAEYDLLQRSSKLLARPDTILYLSLHPRILRRRLRADSSRSPLAMMQRRRTFVQTHRKLFQNLPFKHYYTTTGQPLRLSQQLSSACFFGKFQREILCAHHPWTPQADPASQRAHP